MQRFCHHCGGPIGATARFCEQCGGATPPQDRYSDVAPTEAVRSSSRPEPKIYTDYGSFPYAPPEQHSYEPSDPYQQLVPPPSPFSHSSPPATKRGISRRVVWTGLVTLTLASGGAIGWSLIGHQLTSPPKPTPALKPMPTSAPTPTPTSAVVAMTSQDNWRWCSKCEGLWWAGDTTHGVCPADKKEHVLDGSSNYTLLSNTDPAASGQDNWRWCSQCEGLWWAGDTTHGVCPANGAGHSLQGSGDYEIAFHLAIGQNNWRWCSQCEGLWWAGGATHGVCPANGAGHSLQGSGDYALA
jgi:hypothetical protein